jgi:hypothetical protein
MWSKEVLQHIEIHVTRNGSNGSLGKKRMTGKPVFCWQHRKHSPSQSVANVQHLDADSVIL